MNSPTPTTGPSGLVELVEKLRWRLQDRSGRKDNSGTWPVDVRSDELEAFLAALTPQPGEAAALAGERDALHDLLKQVGEDRAYSNEFAGILFHQYLPAILAALVPADPAKGETQFGTEGLLIENQRGDHDTAEPGLCPRTLAPVSLSINKGRTVTVEFDNADAAFGLFNELKARSTEALSPTTSKGGSRDL